MDQHETVATKRAAPPGSVTDKPAKKQKTAANAEDAEETDLPTSTTTFQDVREVKEAGKQTHFRAPKTRETYARHIDQARRWLKSHFKEDGTPSIPSHPEEGSEIYHDPAFKDVFERQPNHCSNEALSIYLAWKGFSDVKKCAQSTIDGIQVAFKWMWDEASVL